MTYWYHDLTSTNQELQKCIGIGKALKFEKETIKHPNLISGSNLLFSGPNSFHEI